MSTITFRAKKRYWITDVILPGLAINLFLGAGIYYDVAPVFMAIVLLFVMILGFFQETLPMWRNYIRVDESKLEAKVGKNELKVFWDEVIVAKHVVTPSKERSVQHYIMLGTLQGVIAVPNMKYFGRDEVWEAVQARVPAEALAEDAYKNLPDYQVEASKYPTPTKVEDLPTPIRVSDPRLFKWLVWVGPIFFVLAVILDWRDGQIMMSPISLMFVLLSGLLYLIVGYTEVDNEFITRTVPFRQYRMAWSEVERVEVNGTATIIFFGKDKQLKISGPVAWAKPNKERMAEYIRSRIIVDKIEFTQADGTFKRSKNVRVRKQNWPSLPRIVRR
ncbi:MAG: hypothetical protein H6667_22010 [Ardenticatenaceae bacterium]|nr:hypothetical protein [Ardenticatenaceae bacterium]MCB9444478.1 hypothetical protein [Ardenticatenaceae bacterium]